MVAGNEIQNLLPELRTNRPTEEQSILLDHRSNLIFQITTNLDEPGSGHEHGSDNLAFCALDLNFSVPTNPHQFRQATSVIFIALVHAHRKGSLRVTSIDTYDGQANSIKLMP